MTRARAVVLGLGNPLLSDEGIGSLLAQRLGPTLSPYPEVEVVDGGTLGLGLLATVETASHLIVLDCMRAGHAAGAVTVLTGTDATEWRTTLTTAHEFALPNVLALAELRGWLPVAVAVVGIEPASLRVGVGLSPAVANSLAQAEEAVLSLLRCWGFLTQGAPPDAPPRADHGPAAATPGACL